MMKKTKKYNLLSLLCVFQFVWLQSLSTLNSIPISSRDLSLSGGGRAMITNEISMNPASIQLFTKSLSLNTQILPADISLLSIEALFPYDKKIYFSSISSLNWGTLKDGITNNSFSANDIKLTGGLKYKISHISSLGVSTSYLLSKIQSFTAQSILFTIGIQSELKKNHSGLGLVIRNLGFQFDSFNSLKEKPSFQIQVSGYIKPKYLSALTFSDIIIEKNVINKILITGIEFYTKNNSIVRFSNSGIFFKKYQLNSVALGLQLNKNNWILDIASRNLISIGTVNSISIKKQF